jgi:hypothetical protein
MENYYEVWYAKEPTFHVTDEDVASIRRGLAKTHVLVKTLPISNSEDKSFHLKEIFRYMQGHIWSPNGEARSLIRSLGLHHTSMSVGDVIFDSNEGKYYVVDMVGFRTIEPLCTCGHPASDHHHLDECQRQ